MCSYKIVLIKKRVYTLNTCWGYWRYTIILLNASNSFDFKFDLKLIFFCFFNIIFPVCINSQRDNGRSSHPEVLYKKDLLIFRKNHSKTPLQKSLLNKIEDQSPLLKRDIIKKRLWHRCIFLWISRNFKEQLLLKNTSSGCFWTVTSW